MDNVGSHAAQVASGVGVQVMMGESNQDWIVRWLLVLVAGVLLLAMVVITHSINTLTHRVQQLEQKVGK